jgi:hypothetical protein
MCTKGEQFHGDKTDRVGKKQAGIGISAYRKLCHLAQDDFLFKD